jgi:hypothetical protein
MFLVPSALERCLAPCGRAGTSIIGCGDSGYKSQGENEGFDYEDAIDGHSSSVPM